MKGIKEWLTSSRKQDTDSKEEKHYDRLIATYQLLHHETNAKRQSRAQSGSPTHSNGSLQKINESLRGNSLAAQTAPDEAHNDVMPEYIKNRRNPDTVMVVVRKTLPSLSPASQNTITHAVYEQVLDPARKACGEQHGRVIGNAKHGVENGYFPISPRRQIDDPDKVEISDLLTLLGDVLKAPGGHDFYLPLTTIATIARSLARLLAKQYKLSANS